MAGNTYVTTGYSTYADIPYRQGINDHGPKKPVTKYVAEPRTIEQIRTPTTGNTNYVGSPSKIELLKEFVHSPSMSTAPKGYEPNYELGYENSSSPHYSGQDDRMGNLINNVQTEASRLVKASNFSSPDKYHPSSPVRYASEEAHLTSTESFLGANKHHPSKPGLDGVRSANVSSPKKIGGVLDDLSIRAQPTEPQRRYAKPAFVAKSNEGRYIGRRY